MKYLDDPRLAYWSNFLESVELGDRLLSVRADAFSCELYSTLLYSTDSQYGSVSTSVHATVQHYKQPTASVVRSRGQ